MSPELKWARNYPAINKLHFAINLQNVQGPHKLMDFIYSNGSAQGENYRDRVWQISFPWNKI